MVTCELVNMRLFVKVEGKLTIGLIQELCEQVKGYLMSDICVRSIVYDLSGITDSDATIIALLSRAGVFPQKLESVYVIGGRRYAQMAFQIAAKMSGFNAVRFLRTKFEIEHALTWTPENRPVINALYA